MTLLIYFLNYLQFMTKVVTCLHLCNQPKHFISQGSHGYVTKLKLLRFQISKGLCRGLALAQMEISFILCIYQRESGERRVVTFGNGLR